MTDNEKLMIKSPADKAMFLLLLLLLHDISNV